MTERPGVLAIHHDWSTLSFGGASSTDGPRRELTHAKDVGHDLATVLRVRGDDAPARPRVGLVDHGRGRAQHPRRCTGSGPLPYRSGSRGHSYVDGLRFNTPLVHVDRREADSVNHWRQWSADGRPLARRRSQGPRQAGQETSSFAIADRLHQEDAFKDAGTARYHGRSARLYVAETEVILHPDRKTECSPQEDRNLGHHCHCVWSSPRSAHLERTRSIVGCC